MTGIGFRELADRLVRRVNERVRSGEATERGLARLLGYSQPHIHNVLHGRRGLSLTLADVLLESLEIPLPTLWTEPGAAVVKTSGGAAVPLLKGRLGGGNPFPQEPGLQERGERAWENVPAHAIANAVRPAVAVLSNNERAMWPLLRPADRVLLDRNPALLSQPRADQLCALRSDGVGYVCRCRVVGSRLVPTIDNQGGGVPGLAEIELGPEGPAEYVQGVIVWLGRALRRGEG